MPKNEELKVYSEKRTYEKDGVKVPYNALYTIAYGIKIDLSLSNDRTGKKLIMGALGLEDLPFDTPENK